VENARWRSSMAKEKNEISFQFRVIDGEMFFNKSDYQKRMKMFLEVFEGEEGSLNIEIFAGVKYYRHKYYRSILLPAIAREMGQGTDYVHHMMLKPRFLLEKAGSFEEIPKRFLSKSRFAYNNKFDSGTGELVYDEQGNPVQEIVGYVPSMADISDRRAKQYLQDVEAFFYSEMNGHFDKELNEIITELKKKSEL